ncbi:MAG: diguanylate cyclase (GGDEF)-like protein [Sulfurimonas sp.]|jgi:diguanylate cyclase (GGDEF)-like protein|uniref:diguanylate cyclase n=1 Tax=Sulfurimonas sp. TaxID=2022749 RepID=UPI0039E5D14C
MTNYNKYILLYLVLCISLFTIFFFINDSRDRNIEHQQHILVQQAQTHFQSQSGTREWNDQYLGVYVRSEKILKPHPYLPLNTITTDSNETLFRVNHASMARQLSEIAHKENFKFHLTSLNPLNPINKAEAFEQRALEFIEKHSVKEYYEFNDENFRYLAAILTEKKCLDCHAAQGYNIGDVRGGLSVTLNNDNYRKSITDIEDRNIILKVTVFIFLSLITFLMHRQIQSNQILRSKVEQRTKEITQTKNLLQNVLDADTSLMIVSSGTEIILANETALDFLEIPSLDEFILHHSHVSDLFEKLDDDSYLQQPMKGEHWINYLQREQHNQTLRVMIYRHEKEIHLKVHAKEIQVNSQVIHIIIFDDITDELAMIKILKNEATRDALTQLFNRGKFKEVLTHEMTLSKSTSSPLSIIFLDIDHFKAVNDTYGHDVGDEVLVALAKLLTETVRTGDFVARWGGEEFIITLQSSTLEQAAAVAEKIRKIVDVYDFGTASKQSISLGVTQYINGESEDNFTKRVDEALYKAKNSGRNKVVTK